MVVGDGSKVLQFDLEVSKEPVTLYEHQDTEEDFYFEVLPTSEKLMIFSKEKIEVIDLAQDNQIVATLSKEELELEEVYPTAPI